MYDTSLTYQTGKDLDWGQGYPYAYPADMDVDDSNGDLYIA